MPKKRRAYGRLKKMPGTTKHGITRETNGDGDRIITYRWIATWGCWCEETRIVTRAGNTVMDYVQRPHPSSLGSWSGGGESR